jgi:lambda family phage portal protein
MVGGAYEGASRFDASVALWNPSFGSADRDILPDKPIADARVRDAIRNDAYVANGAELHKDNIVGAQFLLNARPATRALALADKSFDETWEKEFQEEVETIFTLLAESPRNLLDASGMNTLTELVRLGVGIWTSTDEVLGTAEWMNDGRPFATALQMVDLDRLSTPWGLVDSPILRAGVAKSPTGRPTGYHIRTTHPADYGNLFTFNQPTWKFVPAEKPWGRAQVLHIVEQKRIDQTRGISGMVAMLKELRITKKFRDISLQNAVVNATYAASIESDLPSDTIFAQLGGGNVSEVAFQEAISQYATGYLGAINNYTSGAKNMAIDGVKIPHLFPGTKLQMRPAGHSGPLGTDFEVSLLRYLAAGLNVSYEQLSKDYSRTNYSSIRAGMTETWKSMQGRKRRVADRIAGFLYRLWLEEAINKNALSTFPKAKSPLLYSAGRLNMSFEALADAEWIGASRGQIDELKETQAAGQRLGNGLSTREDELSRLGKDWRKVFAQLAREQAEAKRLGLDFSAAQNATNAGSGAAQDRSPRQDQGAGALAYEEDAIG